MKRNYQRVSDCAFEDGVCSTCFGYDGGGCKNRPHEKSDREDYFQTPMGITQITTRLKYEGFTNKLTAAGNGVHEAMNTIYLVFWMKDEETAPVAPDARPRGMAALFQSTLSGFLK